MHATATIAADATKLRIASRTMPNVAVPVWFWHYGTYGGVSGEYGHVVLWVPGRGFLSSPSYSKWSNGREVPWSQWFSSIEEIERTFLAKFRFWSLDINTLQVARETPANPSRKKPMYYSNWLKDGYRQEIKGDNKFYYLHTNRSKHVTSISGQALVSGETSVRVVGPPGANVWHSAVRDKTDPTGSKTLDHVFIEEVTGVIPSTGSLTLTLPVVNNVPKDYRLRGMIRSDKSVKIERYTQKFMVWK